MEHTEAGGCSMAKRKKLTLTQRVERLEKRAGVDDQFVADIRRDIEATKARAAMQNISLPIEKWAEWRICLTSSPPLPWYMRGSEYDRRRNGR